MADLLAHGFATKDDCGFTFLTPRVTLLEGQIYCLDQIVIDVKKEIHAVGDEGGFTGFVQTRRFGYHARIKGEHNILRYDSAGGHRHSAHKHVYDPFAEDRQVTTVEEITDPDDVPTLTDVVRELERWHSDNAGRLRDLRQDWGERFWHHG